jgi:hypothetical protein
MKQNSGLTPKNAIQRLKSIKGEAIKSKDQKDTVYNYEKYLKAKRSE